MNQLTQLIELQNELKHCRNCPNMHPPVIVGAPIVGRVMSIGQAPGIHEADVGKPFGWTAGKTLFKWFERIGVNEATYRNNVYMSAVCRCFPGRLPKGGDRVPNATEIATCRYWLDREFTLLQPKLIIAIGKLAIQQFLPFKKLDEVVGQIHTVSINTTSVEILPLPHPSGLSTWTHSENGKYLLQQALNQLSQHPSWRAFT